MSKQKQDVCTVPPKGWRCTREAGHEGPCAAVEARGFWSKLGTGLFEFVASAIYASRSR